MIHELDKDEFNIARPLFSKLESYNLSIRSVFEQNYRGRIFVNNKTNPSSGFIYLGRRTFNFAGSSKDTDFTQALMKILEEDIFPNNVEEGSKNFMVFYDSSWNKKISTLFEDLSIEHRRFYTVNRKDKIEWDSTLTSEFTIEIIDREFVEKKSYIYPDEIPVKRWITYLWESEEEFYKRGFAFSVIHKKDLVVSTSFCNYLSNDKTRCEIGIITKSDFHRRGLGKNLIHHVLEHCWQKGIEMVEWHTAKENIASRKLAETVGFKFKRRYSIFFREWLQ